MPHPSDTDPVMLKALILEMAKSINLLTDNIILRGTVNSVFDSQSVKDTLSQLKALNDGFDPEWIIHVER